MKHLLFISIFLLSITNLFGQQKSFLHDKYLLVIDVQDSFMTNVADTTKNQFLSEVNAVIQQADPEKVIYIQSLMRILSISFKGVKIDTIPNTNLAKDLMMVSETVFTKVKQNSFSNPEFAAFLKEQQAKQLVIVGLMAEHCVLATALGGLSEGYQVSLIPQAVIGKTEKDKAKALKKMEKKGVNFLRLDL